MKKIKNTIILSRNDLDIMSKKRNIKKININNFRHENPENITDFLCSDLIIFVDENNDTKILKSRYTNTGIEKEIEFNKKVNKIILGVSVVLLSFVLFTIVMFLFGITFKEIQDGFCK